MAYGDILLDPVQGFAGDVATPAAHTAAVVTYPAVPGLIHVFYGAVWSYSGSGTLAGGLLTVKDGSTVIFAMGVQANGQDEVWLPRPILATAGAAMTVTLADGGANVTGTLTVNHDQYTAAWYSQGFAAGLDLTQPVTDQNYALWLPLIGF
jgi:hypothetical protein